MERHKKAVMGPVSGVPCPWCGAKNDFREIQGGFAGEEGLGVDYEEGAVVGCDHCKHPSEIVKIDRRPRIILRQYHKS